MSIVLKIVGVVCLLVSGYLVYEASVVIFTGEITLYANSKDFVVFLELNPKIFLASVISFYFGEGFLFWCGKGTFKDSSEISNALE